MKKYISKFKNEVNLKDAANALECELRKHGSIVIALSGGGDSVFLATFAIKVLGKENVFPIHLILPFSPKNETNNVKQWAIDQDINVEMWKFDVLKNKNVRLNIPERCYFCKKEIMSFMICELSKINFKNKDKFAKIADGTVIDDFYDYRPGMKATDELGVIHPLADAGFSKRILRNLARDYSLVNWNIPASACLATRIPYNTEILQETLSMIGAGEIFLTENGFPGCRIRVFENVNAKIEVPQIYINKLLRNRSRILPYLKKMGFKSVSVDLDGYTPAPQAVFETP